MLANDQSEFAVGMVLTVGASNFLTDLAGSPSHEYNSHNHINFNGMLRDVIGAIFEEYGRLKANENPAVGHWPECDPELAEFHQRGFPLKLAGVCQLWRSIARDYPRNWTTVKVVLSPHQGPNSGTVQVLNQAEIDTIATFSGEQPIRLCFGTSSKSVPKPSSTGLHIGQLLPRVEVILLDATCRSLLATFARHFFPKLRTIYVGDSKNRWAGQDPWSDVLGSRVWFSDVGVKKLVWFSGDSRGLRSGVNWATLDEFRVACRDISLRQEDIYKLMVHCKTLKTLTFTLGINRALPTLSFNNSTIIPNPLNGLFCNESLTTLRIFHRTALSSDSPTPPVCLNSLSLPNLKRLVVEYNAKARVPETQWLTNAAIVGRVEYFHITALTIERGVLSRILRAMPKLHDLRIAPVFYYAEWRLDIPMGYALEDWTLEAIAENSGPLRTFKAYGQSWVTQGTLASFST